mmetsp:Transcript_933/g.1464  ORF Transcript_933/g.1464 Transcript_933/m.1464 type:complete len:326 (-) Transcript_933:145-1122(-)
MQRAEGAAQQAEDIAGLTLVELNGLHGGLHQLLGITGVLDHKIHQRTAMRCSSAGGTGVDATLRLGLSHEAAGAFALVGLHRHGGVHVTERLVDIGDGGWWAALDLLLAALPERLAKVHLGPGQVRQVPAGGLHGRVAAEGPVVATVHWHTLFVNVLDDVLPREAGHGIQRPLLLLPDVQGDSLCGLIHAAPGDQNVLVALCQGTLERLHLADEIEVRRVHLLAVSVLGHELIERGHASRHLPQCLLSILCLDELGTLQSRREEMHGINGYQVHTVQHLWEMLSHQGHKDVVSGQPSSCKHDLLTILGKVLVNVEAKVINLHLQR